jgi:hypothetical protein
MTSDTPRNWRDGIIPATPEDGAPIIPGRSEPYSGPGMMLGEWAARPLQPYGSPVRTSRHRRAAGRPIARGAFTPEEVNAGRRIAQISFDPVAEYRADINRQLLGYAARLNAYSQRAGLGVILDVSERIATPEEHHAQMGLVARLVEERPDAILHAMRSDQGMVGTFLRVAGNEGYMSEDQRVLDAIAHRHLQKENSEIRAYIDKKRGTKAARQQRAATDALTDRHLDVRDVVKAGSAYIDQDIRASFDCRDVPVGWPKRWRNCVPVPERPDKPTSIHWIGRAESRAYGMEGWGAKAKLAGSLRQLAGAEPLTNRVEAEEESGVFELR